VTDAVRELLATDVALDKLARRAITRTHAEQVLQHRHVLVRNLRGHPARPQRDDRRLLIGRDAGGRVLTLVIEATLEPATWMLVTGWESTVAERKILRRR
jgi:hypothetical protein